MSSNAKNKSKSKGKAKAPRANSPKPVASFDIEDPHIDPLLAGAALTDDAYPYDVRMDGKRYRKELRHLQIELLKMQRYIKARGDRVVCLFEGRDAAGKGGCIARVIEHLNKRHARAVALTKPTDAERGEWYFQRYVNHLPTAGNIVLFDRSWYNRGGVERVMGFCSPDEVATFLREAPQFESMLVRDGVHFFKFFLKIGQKTQMVRFHDRRHDPLKTWKLSEIDLAAIDKWDAYTDAHRDIFRFTHTPICPWTVVLANDKRRARIAVIRKLLSSLEYEGKDAALVGEPDQKIVTTPDTL